MAARFKDLVLDATDHQKLADWWCAAIGYVRKDEHSPPEDWLRPQDWPVPIIDPAGAGPLIWVQPVPDRKTVKNRMHIDVFGSVDELVGLGATLVRARDGDNDGDIDGDIEWIEWDVLADPEGNEFCVFAPR